MDNNNGFGLWLRENRDRLGLSREEVGERLDISAAYVAKLEQGLKFPSPKVRVRAQQYFEKPVDNFKVGDIIMVQGISFRIKRVILEMGQAPKVELVSLLEELEI